MSWWLGIRIASSYAAYVLDAALHAHNVLDLPCPQSKKIVRIVEALEDIEASYRQLAEFLRQNYKLSAVFAAANQRLIEGLTEVPTTSVHEAIVQIGSRISTVALEVARRAWPEDDFQDASFLPFSLADVPIREQISIAIASFRREFPLVALHQAAELLAQESDRALRADPGYGVFFGAASIASTTNPKGEEGVRADNSANTTKVFCESYLPKDVARMATIIAENPGIKQNRAAEMVVAEFAVKEPKKEIKPGGLATRYRRFLKRPDRPIRFEPEREQET